MEILTVLLNMYLPVDKYLWNFYNVQCSWEVCKLCPVGGQQRSK